MQDRPLCGSNFPDLGRSSLLGGATRGLMQLGGLHRGPYQKTNYTRAGAPWSFNRHHRCSAVSRLPGSGCRILMNLPIIESSYTIATSRSLRSGITLHRGLDVKHCNISRGGFSLWTQNPYRSNTVRNTDAAGANTCNYGYESDPKRFPANHSCPPRRGG